MPAQPDRARTETTRKLIQALNRARDDREVLAALAAWSGISSVGSVPMGGRPAMTLIEHWVMQRDVVDGAHWSHDRCWCEVTHGPETSGLRMVPPPWDAQRTHLSV